MQHTDISMVSLGCPKNLVDTETMLGLLKQQGYNIGADKANADVIIVNTCGFIGDAKQESIDTILEMAAYKQPENGRCKLLIVTGCLAERYNSEILSEMPEVDAVIGTGDFVHICEVLARAFSGQRPLMHGNCSTPLPEALPRIVTTAPHSAYLKISDGCDNHCTYCVIPSLRGKYRSRSMEDIVAEARSLCDSGVREILLIAQDTTRYGLDIYGKFRLAELMQRLCVIENLHWLRLHYCYPESITDELIDVIAAEPKICKYLDIPIQHANDDILKLMGRRTSKSQMSELFAKLRLAIPDITLRTSVIVGFPSETDEQFNELIAFVRDIRFDRLGAFAYSKEDGTPAAKLKGQVLSRIKERRRDRLMKVAQEISLGVNRSKVGTVIEVLCEGYDAENFLYYGRSRADSIGIDGLVYFGADREVNAGEFVQVEILLGEEYDLTGQLI